MEQDYKKRELDEKFTEIKDTLLRIETQTVKTNGRVTMVEKYMYMVMGAVSILGFLVGAKLLTFIK
jgi:hypothetical protein